LPSRELRAPIKGVQSFESQGWEPPEQIALDTSVVVDFLLPGEPSHGACRRLFRSATRAGSTFVFNRLLETELIETLFRLALKERWGKAWKRQRYDGRARRRAGRLLREGMQSWQELLEAINWSAVDHTTVQDEVAGLVAQYGVGSYDAVHIATAAHVGVKGIATLDHGFAELPQAELIVHTTSSRLKTMRARRQ
jgi:predicted nucleic acid-binding protein